MKALIHSASLPTQQNNIESYNEQDSNFTQPIDPMSDVILNQGLG